MDFPFSSLTIALAGKQPPLGAAVVVVAYMQKMCSICAVKSESSMQLNQTHIIKPFKLFADMYHYTIVLSKSMMLIHLQ